MTTTAKVVLHSWSSRVPDALTMELRYPKFIHGEAKTHRVMSLGDEGGYVILDQEVGLMDERSFSRNASSSRAIPISRYLEEVRSEELRATPSFSVINASGMQGGRPTTEAERAILRELWHVSAMRAADDAEAMALAGGAKQDVNRILEPYVHINVVVTATEWENFFGLRLNKAAQPEMRELAVAAWEARKMSRPQPIASSAWHLPYANYDAEDRDPFYEASKRLGLTVLEVAKRVSVARCARVSYRSFETGKRSTVDEDLKLHDSLLTSGHWSPFEHQATPDRALVDRNGYMVTGRWGSWAHPHEHGNLVGWRQLRKMMPGEAVAPLPEEYRVQPEGER